MKNTIIAMMGVTIFSGSVIAMAGGPDNMSPAVYAPTEEAPPATGFTAFLPNGFYLGTDLGYEDTSGELSPMPGASKAINGFAFGFHAGYDFNRYVGIEADYFRLPRVGYNMAGSFLGNNNNNAYALLAKGILPVVDRFNLFVKAGYSIITADPTTTLPGYTIAGSHSTFYDPIVGGGAEWRVVPHLGINAQYMAIIRADHQYPTNQLVTGGLNYYF